MMQSRNFYFFFGVGSGAHVTAGKLYPIMSWLCSLCDESEHDDMDNSTPPQFCIFAFAGSLEATLTSSCTAACPSSVVHADFMQNPMNLRNRRIRNYDPITQFHEMTVSTPLSSANSDHCMCLDSDLTIRMARVTIKSSTPIPSRETQLIHPFAAHSPLR